MSDDTDKPKLESDTEQEDSDVESESDAEEEQLQEEQQLQEDTNEPVTVDEQKQDEPEPEPEQKLEQNNKQDELGEQNIDSTEKEQPSSSEDPPENQIKKKKPSVQQKAGDKKQEQKDTSSEEIKTNNDKEKSKTNANASNAKNGAKTSQATQITKLKKENAEQAERLKLEENARQELEEMILRLEKQVKAEAAGRKKVEDLLKKTVESESNLKQRMEEELSTTQESLKQVEKDREKVEKEKEMVHQMRDKFETEMAEAQTEVQKAQEALQTAEDRIRATEQMERVKLQTEYQQRTQQLMQEIERLRGELIVRTELMNTELARWRQQAELTALAVVDAKNEVMERKRELDGTKEKMDRLVEKLYIGRERGIELQGSLAYAQLHHGVEQQIKKKLMAIQAPGPGYGQMDMGGSQFSAIPSMTPMLQQQFQEVGNKVGRKPSAQKLAPLQMEYGFGGGQSAYIEDVSQGYADVGPRYMQRTMQALKKGQDSSNDRRQKPKKKGQQDRFGEMQQQSASVQYTSKW